MVDVPRDSQLLERVGAAVWRFRVLKGWTQEELAHRAGINVTTLARIERAQVNLSLVTFLALVTALGVDAQQLLVYGEVERRGRGRPKRS